MEAEKIEELEIEGTKAQAEESEKNKEVVKQGVHNYSTEESYVWPTDPSVCRKLEWFRDQKLALMVHWGPYSQLGLVESWALSDEDAEWSRNGIDWEVTGKEFKEQYFGLNRTFNPIRFEPEKWADIAKESGIRYLIFTTKHHDGFCMWDSRFSEYKITSQDCPFHTNRYADICGHLFESFRKRGIGIAAYFSKADWHIDSYWAKGRERGDYMWRGPSYKPEEDKETWEKFVQFTQNQIKELGSNYGKIDIMWFDFSYDDMVGEKWRATDLVRMIRKLQPGIIIDNRTQLEQDLWTPEQYQPLEWIRHKETGELVTWEACQTFSGSWCYYRDETTWKSPEMLIRMLVNTVSLGGNLLMNVGPTSRGYIDQRAKDALKVYEDWMSVNSRSIYNCTMAEPEFKAPADCRFTQSVDGKRLYVHLFAYPYAHLQLRGLAGKVDYAQFLHDGSELLLTEGKVDHFSEGAAHAEDLLVINLPPVKPNVVVPVIELFLK